MEEFETINTGNGIDRDLAATTNDRLKKAIIAMRDVSSSVSELKSTVVHLDKKSGNIQKIILTIAILSLVVAIISIFI